MHKMKRVIDWTVKIQVPDLALTMVNESTKKSERKGEPIKELSKFFGENKNKQKVANF